MSSTVHDEVVAQLAEDLRRLLGSDRPVLTAARCQLLDGFPECFTTFDVAVFWEEPQWWVNDLGSQLGPHKAPCVGVNVVTAESLEEDTIRTPNILARTGVSEYVLFDPNAEVLRP